VAYPFPVRPWADIIGFYEGLVADGATFVRPVLLIAQSVVAEGAADELVGHTSMQDLVVTSAPVAYRTDSVRVSLLPDLSRVRISHHSPFLGHLGLGDSIERDVDDAVPLFWRFCIEKFGVHPARDLA
jgi:hypothetical protein